MFKKLIAMFKNFKKESKSTANRDYQKKYGSYTAGYRHNAI